MLEKQNTKNYNTIAILWVFICILGRLVPHPANVTPITSTCLFSGAKLNRYMRFAVILAIMLISDTTLAYLYGYPIFSFWSLFTYSGFGAIILLGSKIKSGFLHRQVLYVIGSSLGFWIWTNFGVWLCDAIKIYPKTIAGLLHCYTLALPFLRNALLGDLVWFVVVFGVYNFVFVKSESGGTADALDLGSSGATCESSSLSSRTKK